MASEPRAIIVTNCTNRKKNIGEAVVLAESARAQSLPSVGGTWAKAISKASRREVAANLYQGRSFFEAKLAAQELSSPLYIVSAGLGLVCSDEEIPAYNLTVAASPDNLLNQTLNRLGKSPSDWWQEMVRQFGHERSLHGLASRTRKTPILLAVPSAYLSLLVNDLGAFSDAQVARLRIITSTYGAAVLPERLRATVMPYDERLEGLKTYAGTRNDFPQRALRHFVAELRGHEMEIDVAKKRVQATMATLCKPVVPKREKKSDAEIEQLLIENWARLSGSRGKLLRFLRDDALVACEYSRLGNLHERVKQRVE